MKKLIVQMWNDKYMRLDIVAYVATLILVSMLFSGCENECEVEQTYTYYEPVYTSFETLRSSVELLPPQPMESHGKIFFKDNYLFINEPNEGVHIIDNQDPANPKQIAFINVPGSFDIVVKDNSLYADSYVDLVIIDISDVTAAKEVGRVENVFDNYNSYGFFAEPGVGVVTDWQEVERVEAFESDCDGVGLDPWNYLADGIAVREAALFSADAAVSPSNPGMAGSMSRFALAKNHLFVIDQSQIIPFDLVNDTAPVKGEKVYVDWGIETLFPYGDHLFIGAQAGMHILTLDDPSNPELISTYSHVRSCDPVVVDGNYAYVTLRSGSACQGFTNQLEVINISDKKNPQLEYVYEMFNPHGLGKDGNTLFVCDGTAGLKVFDATHLDSIGSNMIAQFENIQAYDIIPFNHVAMMIGEDGLYQYDYTDPDNIQLLSHIKVGK